MRIYISVDMEGINGVVHPEQVMPGHAAYEESRNMATIEVNAVADGLRAAGVTEIVVNDSHGHSRNLIPALLRDDIIYYAGDARRDTMTHGLDANFDAAILLGYHAKAGTPMAVLCHTYYAAAVSDIKINGVSYGEIGLAAIYAGNFNVPIIMISGDLAATAELSELNQDVRTVVTKEATGRFGAKCRPVNVCVEALTDVARLAVSDIGKAKILSADAPLNLEVSFFTPELADGAAMVPAATRKDALTVSIECKDITEAFRWRQVFTSQAESAREIEF
jgi:D-amino peptidase